VLIPLVLTPLYAVVAPVSTLMIYERVVHGPIDRHVPLEDANCWSPVVMSEDGDIGTMASTSRVNRVRRSWDGPPAGTTVAMQTVKNSSRSLNSHPQSVRDPARPRRRGPESGG
jgi:monofunctional biosynthetic peptidoglycan transglycosylase